MRRIRQLVTGSAVGCIALLAACSDTPGPTAPDLQSARAGAQDDNAPSAAALDAQIPGFGGFFLDGDGSPTVYLTRGADRGNAERALAGFLRSRGGAAALRIREASYSWGSLQRWQAAATAAAFEAPGAVFVDNDEASNRVRVGVEDLAAAGRVRAAASRLGIPDGALVVELAPPVYQIAAATHLRGTDRPVRAGMQINFPGYVCSLGFNANSGTQRSFVTASHCTNTQGGVESTPYWQPTQTEAPSQVASEVSDPNYVRNGAGCPKGRRCRYSDAARAVYTNAADQALGVIARTTGANNNSLSVVGSFTVTQDDCTGNNNTGGCLPVGTTVNKVGRTTGWTRGNITNTCVNTGVSGTNIVQLCQTFVTAGVAGGDSGSGVWQDLGNNNAKIVGILWGGSGASFVYSPLANVVRELGALVTH